MAYIYADATTIDDLAKAFDQFRIDLENAAGQLDKVAVEPGNFTDGDDLKSTVTDRTTALRTNLKGLVDACNVIKDKLHTVATTYRSTEDQNKLQAADLQSLIDGVDGVLPGLKE